MPLDLRYEYQSALGRWDLVLGDGGRTIETVDGIEELTRRIKQYLRTGTGEWFLDLNMGVPWFSRILGAKRLGTNQAAEAIRSAVAGLDGVTSVKQVNVSFDSATRTVTVALDIITIYGALEIVEAVP